MSLVVLIASWGPTALVGHSLWPLIAGVTLLDFAVQAVHVSNQHFLTAAHPDRTSTVIGAYMAFYSCGSATGAITTTTAYAVCGWSAACVLGAIYAAAALITVMIFRPTTRPHSTSAPARLCRQALPQRCAVKARSISEVGGRVR